MSRSKLEREHVDQVTRQLRDHGINRWEIERTKGNHLKIKFRYGDRRHIYVVSGSSDWKVMINTRLQVRAMLEGRR